VDLKSAGQFVIISKAGVTNVPASTVVGNIAVSPITFASMTGWALTNDPSNQFAISSQVAGKSFAADYASGTPARLTIAVIDMQNAYTDAQGSLLLILLARHTV
jgi:hypothetical protein